MHITTMESDTPNLVATNLACQTLVSTWVFLSQFNFSQHDIPDR